MFETYVAELDLASGETINFAVSGMPDAVAEANQEAAGTTSGPSPLVLILVIAGVNFMNLATARSTTRAREVGLRKVVGSKRPQLVAQFLTESVILSLIALVAALAVVYLFLPWYNNMIQLQLQLNLLSKSWIIPLLITFAIMVGILA